MGGRRRWRTLAVVACVAGTVTTAVPGRAEATWYPGDGLCVVEASYRVFLDRELTPEERAAWIAGFKDGTASPDQVIWQLPQTDEWLGHVVRGIYHDALDRDPDPSGLAHWIDRLAEGALVNEVGASVYGSSEFYRRSGATPSGFVEQLYTRILHRSPDGPGLAYWTGRVAELGRGRVAASFFGSTESRTDRVRDLYDRVLGRAPDAAGLAFWRDRLRTVNDVQLAILLADSSEFRNRAQHAGCAGVAPGTTTRVSDGSDDAGMSPGVSLSADGRQVGFGARMWDRATGEAIPLPGGAGAGGLSADGRYFAFTSGATLVPGDVDVLRDVHVWDRQTGSVVRITAGQGDADTPSISGDGRYVAYVAREAERSSADSWDHVFVWDRTTGETTRITPSTSAARSDARISADGGHVTYLSMGPPDSSGVLSEEVYVWDRATGSNTALTEGSGGGHTAPTISGDGRFVAFVSGSSHLVPGDDNATADVFVWDRTDDTWSRLACGTGFGCRGRASISADGRHVAFVSAFHHGTDDVTGEGDDVFVWHGDTGTVSRVSNGEWPADPEISADGSVVAYRSDRSMLGGDDLSERTSDVFVWERSP